MTQETYTLELTKEELDYVGAAVGQMDIEYDVAPPILTAQIHTLFERAGLDKLGLPERQESPDTDRGIRGLTDETEN